MQPKLIRAGTILICLLIVVIIVSDFAVSKRAGCPSRLTDCDGKCINVEIDERNCGYCGNVCDPGESCRKGECISRSCRKNCDDGDPCTRDSCSRGKCSNEPIVCDVTMTCCEGICCPPAGASIIEPPSHGKLTKTPDGTSFTYEPDPGYCGPDVYTIRYSDGCCIMSDEYMDILVECEDDKT